MREVDVGALLEERRLNRFHALTLGLCVLILFVDGLDFSASNVGAPAIIRGLGLERSEMGFIQSAGYSGIFFGSLLFGYLGDRYGRRFGAILGVLAYSIPGLFAVFVTSYEQLAALRFLTGLGMGGVVPNVIALLTETAPKTYRATFVMIAYVGYSMGNSVIAQVAAWFIPSFGWSIVFVVASLVGLVLCAFLLFALPESISYLTVTQPGAPQLKRLMSRIAPEQDFAAARFVVNRPAAEQRFSLRLLFTGSRRIATPLLWLGFFSEFLTYMTLASVLSLILEDAGLQPTQASLTFSYAYVGAMIAILALARPVDFFGPKAAVVSASIAMAALVYLGTPGLSPLVITGVAIVALALSSATHQSLNGIVGGFYPTIIRGNGVGYASGCGRVAAIIGPAIAGLLYPASLSLQQFLYCLAAPYLVLACVLLALERLQKRMRADATVEREARAQPAASAPLKSA
jgi:AAHS family 4-hydroxybenzoate transporter-like MFS transporter